MPLDVALAFAARGCRVFPCIPRGTGRKRPLTPNGFHDASIDPAVIAGWWRRWPDALIGVSTGAASGFIVLDVDVKHADRHGFDTLGYGILRGADAPKNLRNSTINSPSRARARGRLSNSNGRVLGGSLRGG
jgi:hypothetical protein